MKQKVDFLRINVSVGWSKGKTHKFIRVYKRQGTLSPKSMVWESDTKTKKHYPLASENSIDLHLDTDSLMSFTVWTRETDPAPFIKNMLQAIEERILHKIGVYNDMLDCVKQGEAEIDYRDNEGEPMEETK